MTRLKHLVVLIALTWFATAISAQTIRFSLLSSSSQEAVVRVDFGSYHTENVMVNGEMMQKLHAEKTYPILESGQPELLQSAFSLIIPEDADPNIEILDVQFSEIENFALAPSKGKLYRNQDPETVSYTKGPAYQCDKYLMGSAAAIGDDYQLRDYHGVSIKVYPFDYNPVAKKLKVYSSVTMKVKFNGSRSVETAQKNNRTFDAVYGSQFLNYGGLRGTMVNEEGAILVIAPEEFMPAMQPYVDWKIKNGYPTEMVSVVTAGNNANAIKSYISNYYNDHNLAFVVIVGDNAQFPTPTVSGNKSDNYFTELVGNDSYPDIILGKISAETVDQVETQVQRFIAYEQNPSETSHFPVFMGIASDQGPGDNNEYDYQHIRNIDNKLQTYTYTSGYELFEGSQGGLDDSGNPTASMVSTAVNSGVGIISYCGHGDVQEWVTTGFNNNNVNALTNVGKLPFILSVACVNGEYHTGTCFAEAWLRATHNGEPTGAAGFLGSTINQPWNSPMCSQDAMIDLLIGTTPADQKFTFGGMFFNGEIHMLDVYNDVEVFRTWILFGDPTLLMRTDVPQQLEVAYTEVIPVGVPNLSFTSTVDNAKISVTHGNEIVAVGRIEDGQYALEFSQTYLPTDTLNVLAVAPNYLPYEGTISFIPNVGPYVITGSLDLVDAHLQYVNNRPNNLPEFGKIMKAIPQIINIGSDPASNVLINISTEDEYISFVGNDGPCTELSLTVPSIASHDTLDNPPYFFFKVDDLAPANHNSVIKMSIIFNDDTVRQSKTVKLYAPELKITSLVIDDDETGNGNHRIDFNETVTCKVTIKNMGNMPIVGGALFLENPGNEILLQVDTIHFPAIEANGFVTVPFQVTAASTIEEPVTTFLITGIWVNFYHDYNIFPVKIGAIVEDWETGDFTNMQWQNTSSVPWTIVSQNPHSGSYCAKSGSIGSSASTMLRISSETTISDSISFYYRVSSEENGDKLTFKIDGRTKGTWSGNIPWTYASFPVLPGTHTYTWTYSKDYWGSHGMDCAFVDDIVFPGGVINNPVSIEDHVQNSANIQVWPNPTADVLHIQMNEEGQEYTYQLYNLAGQLLRGGRLEAGFADIDVQSCASGTYILKVENRDHETQTVKIVKR